MENKIEIKLWNRDLKAADLVMRLVKKKYYGANEFENHMLFVRVYKQMQALRLHNVGAIYAVELNAAHHHITETIAWQEEGHQLPFLSLTQYFQPHSPIKRRQQTSVAYRKGIAKILEAGDRHGFTHVGATDVARDAVLELIKSKSLTSRLYVDHIEGTDMSFRFQSNICNNTIFMVTRGVETLAVMEEEVRQQMVIAMKQAGHVGEVVHDHILRPRH